MATSSAIVLGIDGGLAHLGWAAARVAPGERPIILGGGVVETAKRAVGTASDSHIERAIELHQALVAVVERFKPVAFCAEAFSQPRDARSAAMLAWSLGVVCSVADRYGAPLRAKSPVALKAAFTGERLAKKDLMISTARELYPECIPFFPSRRDLHEHLADSIAALHAFYGVRA